MQFKKYSTISVKIDCNHESQLRKSLSIGCSMIFGVFVIFIYCTEKKYMKYNIYIFIFYFNAWKLLEFPAMVDDLRSCVLQCLRKVYKLIFSISAQNHSDFSDFSGNSCAGMAIFAISKLLFVEFPDYSGFSLRIWQIVDVFGTCNEH